MDQPKYSISPTPIGAFGLVWTDHGIARTWMHDRTADGTRRQILRAYPQALEEAPPAAVAASMADVVALLAGDTIRVSGDLDMRGVEPFDRRVYEVARTIPPGETMTYGAVAKALGEEPMRARDVGVALSRNPFAPIVPCHRIVAAGGRLGGYSAPGGAATKRRLLELEGAAVVAPAPGPVQAGFFD